MRFKKQQKQQVIWLEIKLLDKIIKAATKSTRENLKKSVQPTITPEETYLSPETQQQIIVELCLN